MKSMQMPTDSYHFGTFTVDVLRERVERDGVRVPLRPKSFALLRFLLANADRLVTKDELMAALWPKMVVTDDSLTRCISEVRAAIGDVDQTMIRTVPRRGYVFAEPLAPSARVESVVAAPAVHRAMPAAAAPRHGRAAAWLGVLAAIAVVALASFAVGQRTDSSPRMSMVVLPFETLAPAQEQRYLADTLTEDLTVALSRLKGATVVSSGTAFAYRGSAIDPRAVGSELGVRYVVQGRIEPTADGLRISAGLVDGRSAARLWSDQFDISRTELLKARERIATRLASALDLVLVRAESDRRAATAPAELDAEDLAMRCTAASTVKQGEGGALSYALCERALTLDPRNVRALVKLATYYGERVERNQSPRPAEDLARARGWADRALDADPLYAEAHCANATVRAAEHRLPEALVAADRCRALNPSSVRSLRTLAVMHFFRGEPEQTIAYCDRGMALSPRDPHLVAFMLFKGWAYVMMGRDDDALIWLRKADGAAPDTPSIMLPLVSTLAHRGQDAEARQLLARYLSSDRTRTRTLAQWQHEPGDSPTFLAFAERFKDGLRKAGMPES